MKYGYCHLSVVPCRADHSDKSEMVTQLLFGETIKIYNELKNGWTQIKTAYDNYECWIDRKQYIEISEETFKKINDATAYASDLIHPIRSDNTVFPILIGSNLPSINSNNFEIEGKSYFYDGDVIDNPQQKNRTQLIENAYSFLNAPYLWGGKSIFGIDCSGFTQLVYKLNGIKIPRDASQQAEKGQTLSFIEEAQPGDLAFFDNEEGNIIHVGILLENNNIIHASGMVRIDKIDHQGIFNPTINNYTHRLRIIKKLI